MQLLAWMNKTGTGVVALAEMLTCGRSTIYRYLHGRVPRKDHMARLHEITGGQVGPADFYQLGATKPTSQPRSGRPPRLRVARSDGAVAVG